jgi:hypothetical protein
MLSLPNYHTRVPDQTFILSDTCDTGDGRAGDHLIGGMRGDDWAMVHLPYGGDVEVDLAKSLPNQTKWRAWWVDPRIGSREQFQEGDVLSGKETFKSPSSGSLEDDWLLLLETGSRIWP